MKLNKDGIREEDKKLAISLYNYLKAGSRVIGNPSEGLKETLKKLEAEEGKGKEHITGFKYEPWHYRYVGKDVASYIYKNNITLEEYTRH